MFKDVSKIMKWYIFLLTCLCRNVTIVRGASYHLLGSQIFFRDSKIRFNFKSNLTLAISDISELQHLARYFSCHNAMAYDTHPHK
jgi:hypothetical protein